VAVRNERVVFTGGLLGWPDTHRRSKWSTGLTRIPLLLRRYPELPLRNGACPRLRCLYGSGRCDQAVRSPSGHSCSCSRASISASRE
jgi:hypothetical protein